MMKPLSEEDSKELLKLYDSRKNGYGWICVTCGKITKDKEGYCNECGDMRVISVGEKISQIMKKYE